MGALADDTGTLRFAQSAQPLMLKRSQHFALCLDPERGDDQGSNYKAARAKRENTGLTCDWQDYTGHVWADERSKAANSRCVDLWQRTATLGLSHAPLSSHGDLLNRSLMLSMLPCLWECWGSQ